MSSREFVVRHGNIASVMYVEHAGVTGTFFIMSDGVIEAGDLSPIQMQHLPLAVTCVMHDRAQDVMSLPVTEREAWIKRQVDVRIIT